MGGPPVRKGYPMKFTQGIAAIAAVAVVTLSLSKGAAAAANGPAIKMTAIISTSGRYATQGIPERQGMMLAASQINAAGGIGGRQLDITVLDDEGKPDVAAQLATQAAGSGAVALIGGVSVATGQAVARVASESKLPFIILNPASETWATKNGIAKYIFQTTPANGVEAPALVAFAKDKLHAKKAALIVDENAYGQEGMQIMADLIPKSGMTLTTSQTYPSAGSDFTPQVLAAKNTNPDVIFLWGAATAPPLVVRAIRQLGVKAEVIGTTGIVTPAFLRVAAKDGEGVYSDTDLNFTHPSAYQRSFIEAYHKMWHQTPANFSAFAYDAVQLFANAIRSAHGKTDGDSIANAMESMHPLTLATGTFRMTAKDHNGLTPADVHIAVDKNEIWFNL